MLLLLRSNFSRRWHVERLCAGLNKICINKVVTGKARVVLGTYFLSSRLPSICILIQVPQVISGSELGALLLRSAIAPTPLALKLATVVTHYLTVLVSMGEAP
jgi:hypothetical protein